jgi:hypothetical protein
LDVRRNLTGFPALIFLTFTGLNVGAAEFYIAEFPYAL